MDDDTLKTRPEHRFDNPDNSDIVLRTSDEVPVFASKSLLMFASPFFSNLFADGVPGESYQNLPVVDIPEPFHIFKVVVAFCYPDDIEGLITEVDDLVEIVRVMQKYCMERAERRLRAFILRSPLIRKHPLRLFAISRYFRWKDVCLSAADHSLCQPLRDGPRWEELDLISGRDYAHLLDFHAAGSRIAISLLSPTSQLTFLSDIPWMFSEKPTCSLCGVVCTDQCTVAVQQIWHQKLYIHPWLSKYIVELKKAYAGCPRPVLNGQRDDALKSALAECPKAPLSGVDAVFNSIERQIATSVSQIVLQIGSW